MAKLEAPLAEPRSRRYRVALTLKAVIYHTLQSMDQKILSNLQVVIHHSLRLRRRSQQRKLRAPH